MNLRDAIVALRWSQQREAADFAKEIGITTKEYLRFERKETISVDVMLAILNWALIPAEKPTQEPLQ